MAKTRTSWEKGCPPPNPKGRPRNKYAQELHDALEEFKKDNNESFVQFCMKQAKTEPALANAILKKFMPDLKYVESDVTLNGSVSFENVSDTELAARIEELESLGSGRIIQSTKRAKIKKRKK